MNLLYANDRPGEYPDSWYAATADLLPRQESQRGETRADVCIVGAGYTGLSAALHLARAGVDVAVVDAQRIGFGASGRNGGQLGGGQRVDQVKLEKMVGRDAARQLWELGEDAKQLVKSLIAELDIDCALRPGVAWCGSSNADVQDLHDYANHLARDYGYSHMDVPDAQTWRTICPSPDYTGGIIDRDAGHVHPLRLVLGLARACLAAGVRIYEQSGAHHIKEGTPVLVQTDRGRVLADHVILAGNGYLGGLNRKVAAQVMPLNNYIVATEPLGTRAQEVLTQDIAVADSRFVINYFRLSEDKRLLFGGGESYGYRFPKDIRALVRKPLLEVFPSLHDVELTHAWGGTLAITMKRLPYVARLGPNVLSASGYSGHGVGTAIHAGMLMAQAIRGQSDGFDTMAQIPTRAFPGGSAMRSPLLTLAMSWYAMRDRLGF